MNNTAGVETGRRRVAITGATGYAGQELVRLLARHPHVELVAAMASSASTARELPALRHLWPGTIEPLDMARQTSGLDAVFLALPEDASAELAPALAESGARVFDLSGAFRLVHDEARDRWYPKTGTLPGGVVYGAPERLDGDLQAARIVSCPGCYPTAASLALAPLVRAGLVAGDIVIDAKSGVSGAGKKTTERTHFSECHGNLSAYGVFSHRHAAEIEQEVGCAVTFVPHLVPIDRGILETMYLRVRPGTTDERIAAVYADAYANAPFVRVTGGELPTIKQVAHTNFCDIGWRLDAATHRLVVVSAIDNLLKGAAGQAVQLFNLVFGFDERAGLWG
jgi:N-acetyl-gamma-glutamyl-phosphate reductase